MRFAAPSVVCPRCEHESPPSGAGRFMSCAKCGMSIDMEAGEKLQPMRRAKTEDEIVTDDPKRPPRTKQPWSLLDRKLLAVVLTFAVLGAIWLVGTLVSDGTDDERAERHANVRQVEKMQRAIAERYAMLELPSCKLLLALIAKPCKDTVRPDAMTWDAVENALFAAKQNQTCGVLAVDDFRQVRLLAGCD